MALFIMWTFRQRPWLRLSRFALLTLALLTSRGVRAQDPEALIQEWQVPDAAHCPEKYQDADGASCPAQGAPLSCQYKGWTCACQSMLEGYCGGAPPRPRMSEQGALVCQPTNRAALREDGCPWYEPKHDKRCQVDTSLTCAYEPDCSTLVVAQCVDGRWSVKSQMLPPRP